MFIFFFFKQKTAYEIKECDWSSDVCSSDLEGDTTTGGDSSAPTRGSYEGVRQYWGTHCTNQAWTTLINAGDISGQTRMRIQTHEKLIWHGVWRAFRQVVIDQAVRIYTAGCYDCRAIVNSDKMSYHAWGLALDVNAGHNAGWNYYIKKDGLWYTKNLTYYGTSPASADPQASSLASAVVSRIKLGTTGKSIFYWGGNWTTVKDYMHFEVHVTAEELETYGVYLDGQPVWDLIDRGVE